MKRSLFLTGLLGAAALSMSVAAYQQPPQPQPLEAQKVRDNFYMLVGGGGNTGVFIGANGVTVIDTKNPGYGAPILAKIKEITPKPVTMIINTHTHGDHVSGNVEFPATVDVVTQENTAANMKKMAPVTGLPQNGPPTNIFEQNGGRNLAKRTFKDRMTIGSGAERIELYYFGRAHTNGDAWIVFPALRLLHAGDAFAFKQPPIMDANNGGSGIDYPETLAKAYASIKNVDTIINGHMPAPTTPADLKEYEEYVRDFVTYAQNQKKAGKSVDEAAAGYKVPDRFKGYTAAAARVPRDGGHGGQRLPFAGLHLDDPSVRQGQGALDLHVEHLQSQHPRGHDRRHGNHLGQPRRPPRRSLHRVIVEWLELCSQRPDFLDLGRGRCRPCFEQRTPSLAHDNPPQRCTARRS